MREGGGGGGGGCILFDLVFFIKRTGLSLTDSETVLICVDFQVDYFILSLIYKYFSVMPFMLSIR